MGKGGAEFIAGEEMIGTARAVEKGALIIRCEGRWAHTWVRPCGESFVEQKAARGQSALDGGEGGAVEIVEAENQVEGCFGQGGGFQIRFDEDDAGERMAVQGYLYKRGAALDRNVVRGGQRGGAVERGRSEIHGHDGPAALGEPNGVLPRAAGEIERAGTGMGSRKQGESFDEECRWFRRRVGGGFAMTGLPALEGGIHGGLRGPLPGNDYSDWRALQELGNANKIAGLRLIVRA